MIARLVFWALVAVALIGVTYLWRLGFSVPFVQSMFRAKLTFLALIMTIGAFQYSVLMQLGLWAQGRPAGDQERRRMEEEVRPRIQVVLVDTFVVGVSLLCSNATDMLMFLLQRGEASALPPLFLVMTAFSTGLFAFSFLPMFAIARYYLMIVYRVSRPR